MQNIERLESEIAKELRELERIQGVLRNFKGSHSELEESQDKENRRPASRLVTKPPLKPNSSLKQAAKLGESQLREGREGEAPQKHKEMLGTKELRQSQGRIETSKNTWKRISPMSTPALSEHDSNSLIELPESLVESVQYQEDKAVEVAGFNQAPDRQKSRQKLETQVKPGYPLPGISTHSKSEAPSEYESLQEFIELERQQSRTAEYKGWAAGQPRTQTGNQGRTGGREESREKQNKGWNRISSSEGEDSEPEGSHDQDLRGLRAQEQRVSAEHDQAYFEDDEPVPSRQHSRRKHKSKETSSEESAADNQDEDDDYGALIDVIQMKNPVSRKGPHNNPRTPGMIPKTSRESSPTKRPKRGTKSPRKKGWTFSHEKMRTKPTEKCNQLDRSRLQQFCQLMGEKLLSDDPNLDRDHQVSQQNNIHNAQGSHMQKARSQAKTPTNYSCNTSVEHPSNQTTQRYQPRTKETKTITDIGMAEYEEMCARFREARMEAKTFDDKVKLLVLEKENKALLRELIRRAQEKDKIEKDLRECTFTPKKVARDPVSRVEARSPIQRESEAEVTGQKGRHTPSRWMEVESAEIREILGKAPSDSDNSKPRPKERSRPSRKPSFERTFYERNKQWDLDRQNKIDIVRMSKEHLPESYTFKPETTQYNPTILHEYPRELKDSNYMQEALASYYNRMEKARHKSPSLTPQSRRSNSNSMQRYTVVGPPSCLEERSQARKSVEAKREKLKEKVVSKYQKKRIQLHDQLMQTSMFK